MDIFKKAAKAKLRFQSSIGLLSTEDLYDLPLTHKTKANLDDIARAVHNEIKESSQESFVDEAKNKPNEELTLKMDILKDIIKDKKEEADARKDALAKKKKKAQILELIEKKENEDLEGKSKEDLEALLKEL